MASKPAPKVGKLSISDILTPKKVGGDDSSVESVTEGDDHDAYDDDQKACFSELKEALKGDGEGSDGLSAFHTLVKSLSRSKKSEE